MDGGVHCVFVGRSVGRSVGRETEVDGNRYFRVVFKWLVTNKASWLS